VHLDGATRAGVPLPAYVEVWRSVRSGGDTKTRKSRRTVALPTLLREHRSRQARARLRADSWAEGLVFSFVSLLSEWGLGIEDISRLVGHSGSHVTEVVYRHELCPVIQTGATAMDSLFAADSTGESDA
jgi:hypothetical protein